MQDSYATNFVKGLVEDKTDPKLGAEVQKHLQSLKLDNYTDHYDPSAAVDALTAGIRVAFKDLGIDPNDPSTQDTPKRFACMVVGELTKGMNYNFFPKCTVQPNGEGEPRTWNPGGLDHNDKPMPDIEYIAYKGAYNQMVLVDTIQVMSLCEHHLQTIDGVAHIAYIPNRKVLGLSKFARIVEFFARRPQIQERMTEQVFEALKFILETEDVAVVIKATHFCMRARGAMQANAKTQTDKVGGRFFTEAALRKEFFDAIRA